jgi:hypothetical protein
MYPYKVTMSNKDYFIADFEVDKNDLVQLINIEFGENLFLLYYHDAANPFDPKTNAKILYQSLRVMTSRTPVGKAYHAVKAALLIMEEMNELIFKQEYKEAGYYTFEKPTRNFIIGNLYGKNITRIPDGHNGWEHP